LHVVYEIPVKQYWIQDTDKILYRFPIIQVWSPISITKINDRWSGPANEKTMMTCSSKVS